MLVLSTRWRWNNCISEEELNRWGDDIPPSEWTLANWAQSTWIIRVLKNGFLRGSRIYESAKCTSHWHSKENSGQERSRGRWITSSLLLKVFFHQECLDVRHSRGQTTDNPNAILSHSLADRHSLTLTWFADWDPWANLACLYETLSILHLWNGISHFGAFGIVKKLDVPRPRNDKAI